MSNVMNRIIRQRGKTVFGGLVGAAVVGGIWLNSLSTGGTEKTGDPFPAFVPVVLDISATGSTSATQKYDALCIGLSDLLGDIGSGTIIRSTYHNISNPTGASADIGFVEHCGIEGRSSSGTNLIDNTCTSTGCLSRYTTGTLDWMGNGSGSKLKVTIKKDPTSSFDAKLTLWLEDNLGE